MNRRARGDDASPWGAAAARGSARRTETSRFRALFAVAVALHPLGGGVEPSEANQDGGGRRWVH
jgi:hypothetical protein